MALKKKKLANYAGYHLRFMFLVAKHPVYKDIPFENPYNVAFDVKEDALDMGSLMAHVRSLPISILELAHDNLMREIHLNRTDTKRLARGLSDIVRALMTTDPDEKRPEQPIAFRINEKIQMNSLKRSKRDIQELSALTYPLDGIYNTYEHEGVGRARSVFRHLQTAYRDNVRENLDPDKTYDATIHTIVEELCEDGSLTDYTYEDVEFYVAVIVVETPSGNLQHTGNNVGKTTVLKLVDFCLGANASIVYTDPEDKHSRYELVESFLRNREVLVTLTLTERIGNPTAKRVTIERNFLQRSKAIRRINGEQVATTDFVRRLGEELLPRLPEDGKPTFRQAIGHNIRYDPFAMENTLKTLGPYGRNVEYEALYLFLLGIPHHGAAQKQDLEAKRRAERRYLTRLLNGHSVSDYQTVLTLTEREVAALEARRQDLSIGEDYASKLEELDVAKMEVSRASTLVSQIDLRMQVIEEARHELLGGISKIDLSELRALYIDAKAFVPELHQSFEDLVRFHNTMIHERIDFMSQDLPELKRQKLEAQTAMEALVRRTKELSDELSLLPTSEQIDLLVNELGAKMRQKGEYETRISQIGECNGRLADLDADIAACEKDIYSPEHESLVREKVALFNERFSQVSQELYGETYMIGVDIKVDRGGTRYYDFHTLDLNNYSAGKKQGEVLSFDIAYVMFAEDQGIDCLHFLLNDRKELMHGNQLLSVSELASRYGCQVIVAILQDKLPEGMDLTNSVVLRLSQESKLFRIEELS